MGQDLHKTKYCSGRSRPVGLLAIAQGDLHATQQWCMNMCLLHACTIMMHAVPHTASCYKSNHTTIRPDFVWLHEHVHQPPHPALLKQATSYQAITSCHHQGATLASRHMKPPSKCFWAQHTLAQDALSEQLSKQQHGRASQTTTAHALELVLHSS